MRYKEDGCLDLAGVCAHACEASGKGRTPQWNIEKFEKDEKVRRIAGCSVLEADLLA